MVLDVETDDSSGEETETAPELIVPEMEPPDGGWGWMVASALAIMFIATTGTWSSFGLIFGRFLETNGAGTKEMTLINSVFPAVGYFTGLLVNPLFKRFSCRQIGVMGGILYFIGSLLSAFVTGAQQLVVTYGLIQGLGMGLLVTASSTSFNSYFTRQKGAAMTVAMAATAVGVMVYPLVIEALQQVYGFRGTQTLLAALSLHAALAMLLLEPVTHHLVPTVPITITVSPPDDDIPAPEFHSGHRTLTSRNRNVYEMTPFPGRSKYNVEYADNYKKDYVPDIHPDVTKEDGRISLNKGAIAFSLTVGDAGPQERQQTTDHMGSDPNITSHNTGSFQFLDNVFNSRVYQSCSSTNITSQSSSTENRESPWWRVITPRLLGEPAYIFLALGVALTEVSDFLFLLLQPLFFMSVGMSRAEAAWCMSLGGATDLAGRLFLALLGVCVQQRNRRFYLAGAVCTVAIRAVYIPICDHFALTLLTGIHGFFRCWMNVPLSLVFSNHCTTEMYPEAFGLFFVISGAVFVVLGPLLGLLRDWTGSYPICMLTLTGLMLLYLVPWFLEVNIVRLRRPWN